MSHTRQTRDTAKVGLTAALLGLALCVLVVAALAWPTVRRVWDANTAGALAPNTLTLPKLRPEPLPNGVVEIGTADPAKVIGDLE
jgi:hypothetical protein